MSSKSRRGGGGGQRQPRKGARNPAASALPPLPWNQPPAAGDPISQFAAYMNAQPRLIVCGRLGLQPLTETQRRELLAGVDMFDAVETVARLQGRWDIAFTTTQRESVEAEFLAGCDGHVCKRARKRVVDHRGLLVAPRSTAQLQREIIEYASTDEAAPAIDLNTLVHILLSISSEQKACDRVRGRRANPG